MNKLFHTWLTKEFPQNYIIRKPLSGSLIIALFFFIFVVFYKPLAAHKSMGISYAATMAIYGLIAAAAVFGFIKLIKNTGIFSEKNKWTFLKEVTSILMILLSLGLVIYLAGFLLEPPAERWNLSTFLDSLTRAILVGIIPFTFFTALAYHQWLNQRTLTHRPGPEEVAQAFPEEEMIQIQSRLKKEKLSFYPSQFLYAESDGNYVNFYLSLKDQIKKKVIRNSIGDIEKQLANIPYIFRTHRAYLVNLKKIRQKKGNASGYRLKLLNTEASVPVSRQKVKAFHTQMERYHF
ncbi:MAG: LytR/AlgR family response regulator transcription factor [Bacteroidota bacterium]